MGDIDGVHGHRCRWKCIDDGTFRGDDRNTSVGAFVPRDGRVEETRNAKIDRRIRVGQGAVLESIDLRISAGEVDHHLIAAHRERDSYRYVGFDEAVVVGVVLAKVGTVGQCGNGEPHTLIGMVEHTFEVLVEALGTKLVDKCSHPLAANTSGPDHCQKVAIEKLGRAAVDQQ